MNDRFRTSALACAIFACAALACSGGGGGAGGAPPVPFTLSASTVTFDASIADAPPVAATVAVVGLSYARITQSGPTLAWADFTALGAGAGVITLTPVWPAVLGYGTHTGNMDVVGCADAACATTLGARRIAVSYRVGSLLAGPATASFTHRLAAAAPDSQSIVLSDALGASGAWTAEVEYDGDGGWLALGASSGAALPATVDVGVVPGLLGVGTRAATVRFSSSRGLATVGVTYTIAPPALRPSPATLALEVDASTTAAGLPRSVELLVDGGGEVAWTAAAEPAWLTVSPAAGAAPTTVTVSPEVGALASLGNGTYPGKIVFTYQDRPDVRVELPVETTVRIPSLTRVAPFVIYDQVASEVVVRGAGLDGLGGEPLRVGASVATDVRVVNGTELRAKTPPLVAGTHSFRVDNALGLATTSADLLVTTRVYAWGDAVLPSSAPHGRTRVVYDPSRTTAFVGALGDATGAGGRLDVVRRGGDGLWALTTVAVPGIVDLALHVDGRDLLVGTGAEVIALDPATLAERARVSPAVPCAIAGLAALNDGRAFLACADGPFALLDVTTGAVETSTDLFGAAGDVPGAAIAGSWDGDTVWIGQQGVPARPLRAFEVGALRLVETGTSEDVWKLGTSATGARLLVNDVRVYARSGDALALLGTVPTDYLGLVGCSIEPRGSTARGYHKTTNTPWASWIHLDSPLGAFGWFSTGSHSIASALDGGTAIRSASSPDSSLLFLAGANAIVVTY